MNIAARLSRYVSAWANLGALGRINLSNCSLEEVVDRMFAYSGGFFCPIQIREEIIAALQEVRALQPKFIVEIGTSGGGTLLLWSRVAHPQATIITLDMPGGAFGDGYSLLRSPLLRRTGLPGQTVHLIRGDSHSAESLSLTRKYLNDNPVDFLFIDADHTEAGVRADYSMYSPLVRPGGLIAFHDIGINRPEYGVRTLWGELTQTHRSRAILAEPHPYGIGLLYP